MINLLSPRKTPVTASSTPTKQEKVAATSGTGGLFCGGANDCIVVGPTSSSHPYQPTLRQDQQVTELEKEVQKQKELKALYRRRFERTQDYLTNCLQIAQDNGFLHILINNNNNNTHQQGLVSSTSPNPQKPPRVLSEHHRRRHDLEYLVHQAQATGWFIEPDEVELHQKIGQGSTAEIYNATWRGTSVAVKCIHPDFFESNENGLNFFTQEVETLSRQRHPFVLRLLASCLSPPNHAWILTELLDMTLKDWLHGSGPRRKERIIPLPGFEERLGKGVEIAQAMQYLHGHRPKVIHRDLKPSNIFLDENRHVRVADFGHARLLSDDEKALTGETGTYVYMAPEVIRCEPYDEKCDVYSFAVILNELITGEPPFVETDFGPSRVYIMENHTFEIAMEVAEDRLRPALPSDDFGVYEKLIKLIQICWDGDAAKRPSFAYITCTLKTILKEHVDPLQF